MRRRGDSHELALQYPAPSLALAFLLDSATSTPTPHIPNGMKMGKLAETLGSLQLQDGRPDLEARRQELDSLAQNLSAEEIRRLRIQLNAITIPNDIYLLPIELLLCIAQHLELLDVITLRSVSRAWNETFSSAEFSIGLIKIHFRPVWERRYRELVADQQQVEKRALMQWLPGATRNRIRRQHGRYQSMSINRRSYNRVSAWQYKNGRVAFMRGPGAILVEDIRTSLGAKYIDENRIDFGEWLLSEDFLLAATNGPISLSAWHLVNFESETHESIRLPARVSRLSAQKNQVGIFTTTHQVFIWTIGGPLLSVNTSAITDHLSDFRLRQGLVVFHPLQQDCFFIVHEAWPGHAVVTERRTCRIVVQRFNEGKLSMTKCLNLFPSTPESLTIPGLLHDGAIGVFKGYVARPGITADLNAHDLQTRSGSDRAHDPEPNIFTIAMFEIYQMRFFFEEYSLPGPLPEPHLHNKTLEQAFYWRKQVLIPVYEKSCDHVPVRGVTESSLIAINQHIPHTSVRTPYNYVPGGSKIRSKGPESPIDIAFYWRADVVSADCEAMDAVNLRMERISYTDQSVIQADDAFVVFMCCDGWVVWCFDKGVKLRPSDSP